jgi:hypothetical protein
MAEPFWKTRSLQEMTSEEWESLCDGCALCCMLKIEDEDTGETFYSDLACRLLNLETGRCTDYPNRKSKVPECLQLTPQTIHTYQWLPPTCAYKLIADGQELFPWHPLISGRKESVHEAGISLLAGAVSEDEVEDFSVLRLLTGREEE